MLSTVGAVRFRSRVIFNYPLCYNPTQTATLPTELLSFIAEAKNSYIRLDWVTTAEIKNDYFTVERRADGIRFSSLFKISVAGNRSHVKNYSTLDDSPLKGWSYNRLKQIDIDGKPAILI
jgi:hypothetical protein